MRVYIIIVSEVMNGRLPSSSDVHTSAGVRAPAHIKIIRETGKFLVFSVGDKHGSGVCKTILFDKGMARLSEQVRSYAKMAV